MIKEWNHIVIEVFSILKLYGFTWLLGSQEQEGEEKENIEIK